MFTDWQYYMDTMGLGLEDKECLLLSLPLSFSIGLSHQHQPHWKVCFSEKVVCHSDCH